MSDTTVTKVDSRHSPHGALGQKYLASGVHVSMRLWEEEPAEGNKPESRRDYETVGYVIAAPTARPARGRGPAARWPRRR